jgi:peptidoglycan-N-acetylglucosamine deacetylase
LLAAFQLNAQQIAITFDDAPTHDSPLLTGDERTLRIIKHLKNNGVRQAAFFVLTGSINSEGHKRLTKYSDAGHLLANHSHSHLWIHEVGTDQYVRDVIKADSILNRYHSYVKWFRYPYLNEGRTIGSRDSIRLALKNLHLTNAYVTVDNYDWYLNNLLQRAVKDSRKVNQDKLRAAYIDHIYSSIVFYDNLARTHLGRSPKHVLLLHENDLSALFLGDLIRYLHQRGWKIISPKEAYHDPIAGQIPDVLFNGQGRIAAIAREKGIPARELVQLSEDEVYLDSLMKEKKVFE